MWLAGIFSHLSLGSLEFCLKSFLPNLKSEMMSIAVLFFFFFFLKTFSFISSIWMARVFWNSFCGKSETDSQIILLSVNTFVEKTSFALSQTSVGHIVFHLFLAPPYLHQRTHLSCYKTESKNLLIPVTLYKVLKSGLVSFLVLFSDGGCFHLFPALYLLTVSSPVPPDTLLKFWWNWRSLGPLRWGDHDQSVQSSLNAGVSPWV